VTGLGAGAVTVVVPLVSITCETNPICTSINHHHIKYIAEWSPPAIRGSLVGLHEVNNQISSLIGYWCNYIVSIYIPPTESRQWQIALAMQIVPSALLLVAALFILPETPRYLLQAGKEPQARKALSVIRNLEPHHEYINYEIDLTRDAVSRQQTSAKPASKVEIAKELMWRGNRNRVIIGIGLMVGQNLTGINAVNFYTPTIFKSIGFDGSKVTLLASG
jgi:MFS family permease